MSAWDDEDFEPDVGVRNVAVADKWEGEDQDDIPDNWENSDEDKKDENTPSDVVQVKKKKPLKERIQEREEKKKHEHEEKKRREEEARKLMTPEENMAEKLRLQKVQEESDLELAKEALGISNDELAGRHGVDAMNPKTAEEFDQFREAIRKKLTEFETSHYYASFLDNLFRDVCVGMDHEDIKKIGSTLSTLASEKAKAVKGMTKSKKGGKKKATTAKIRDNDFGDYGGGGADDYDEFDDVM